MARPSDGENFLAKLPLVGGLTGAETQADYDLIRKQKQLAEDAARRQKTMEQARMNATRQRIGAFAPRNAVMGQMFGPEAAFTGAQMADMTANPMPAEVDPTLEAAKKRNEHVLTQDQYLARYVKNFDKGPGNYDPMEAKMRRDEYARLHGYTSRQDEAARAEQQRRGKLDQQFAAPPPPDPFRRVQAAPARKY